MPVDCEAIQTGCVSTSRVFVFVSRAGCRRTALLPHVTQGRRGMETPKKPAGEAGVLSVVCGEKSGVLFCAVGDVAHGVGCERPSRRSVVVVFCFIANVSTGQEKKNPDNAARQRTRSVRQSGGFRKQCNDARSLVDGRGSK